MFFIVIIYKWYTFIIRSLFYWYVWWWCSLTSSVHTRIQTRNRVTTLSILRFKVVYIRTCFLRNIIKILKYPWLSNNALSRVSSRYTVKHNGIVRLPFCVSHHQESYFSQLHSKYLTYQVIFARNDVRVPEDSCRTRGCSYMNLHVMAIYQQSTLPVANGDMCVSLQGRYNILSE